MISEPVGGYSQAAEIRFSLDGISRGGRRFERLPESWEQYMKSNTRLCMTIWIVVISLTHEARSQTIEVRSSTLATLKGTERERVVEAHNKARTGVGVAPVEWSDALSKQALDSLEQQKASLLDTAKEGWDEGRAVFPTHRKDTKFGENVAGWVGGRSKSAELAVDLWLREKAAFDKLNASSPYRVGDEEGESETDAAGKERPIIVGHYTAIVWSATTQIGAAKFSFDLMDDQGQTRSYTAIVCLYSPPGNRRGERPY
jgi:cysteine-rich secretory family protein